MGKIGITILCYAITLVIMAGVGYVIYIACMDALSEDDTIVSFYCGNGSLVLANGSTVELPANLQDDFYNMSSCEFELAMHEKGIVYYSDLLQYDSLHCDGLYSDGGF